MPIETFMDTIDSAKSHVTRMILFNTIKTGDPIIDAFLTTLILGCFSWLVTWFYENRIDIYFHNLTFDLIENYFYKKNSIVIEGKRSSVVSSYNNSLNVCSAYSDRFKALWNYIIDNVEKNKTIYKIKEHHTNFQASTEKYEDARKNYDMFMVYQNKHFEIDKHIFVKSNIEIESENDSKEKTNIKTDKITITVYSYKYSLAYLKNYIDNITENYLSSIKEKRINKRYIYFLHKTEINPEFDESSVDCWREDIFESARTFKNIFFDGKTQLLERIDFFLNNKDWYYEKGIPYSLGIGLHGPPGTGKTSLVKALANYTNRHIVVISLKMITTKQQLEQCFFENRYNHNNQPNSISWDKKILVFEDIDCVGDIILDRNSKYNLRKSVSKDCEIENKKQNDSKISDILKAVCDLNDSGSTSLISSNKDQQITLDDILNLWDGIRETPGRILIISSNHYDKLDSALIRPGRIDITHQLSNASHNTISEIYSHLFGNKIDKNKLSKIKEYFYSPAELINIYVSNKTEEAFLNRLLKNAKI
jgi:ATP-dependent 26S proteasome regulatory subunit